MNEAEVYARDLGFEYVRTETLDFQARPFYEKQGFEVYGELKDYPKGHTTYCLVKKL
jgi:ribosomal protein S18 acetylase RimI-like enzyme